jgi:hypothetical protein
MRMNLADSLYTILSRRAKRVFLLPRGAGKSTIAKHFTDYYSPQESFVIDSIRALPPSPPPTHRRGKAPCEGRVCGFCFIAAQQVKKRWLEVR